MSPDDRAILRDRLYKQSTVDAVRQSIEGAAHADGKGGAGEWSQSIATRERCTRNLLDVIARELKITR